MPTTERSNGSDPRVAALEASHNSLAQQVQAIDSRLGAIAAEMRAALSGISSQITQRDRPQWAVIFAGLALVLSIGALALAPLNSDQSLAREERHRLDERVRAIETGFAGALQRIGGLERRVFGQSEAAVVQQR